MIRLLLHRATRSYGRFFLFALVLCFYTQAFSQGNTEYGSGFKMDFNKDGTKYMRFISWLQFWTQYNDAINRPEFSVRRARLLMLTQLNPKLLLYLHLGLNSLNADGLSPLGKGESSQLFFHDIVAQYKIKGEHYLGAGLHYFNGISRLNNASTLNLLTLDNNRQSWPTLGVEDQFVRHLGIYAQGYFGKFHYQVAFNEGLTNGADTRSVITNREAVYAGKKLFKKDNRGVFNYAGYFNYNFFEKESNILPYTVGTYLGSKKVFNVGAGFFYHPDGAVIRKDASFKGQDSLLGQNVFMAAADAFLDLPVGAHNAAITAYAVYQYNDFGKNYQWLSVNDNRGYVINTGDMLYAHLGYLIPGKKESIRFQPYVSAQRRSVSAIDANAYRVGVGANIFFTGHHSKLTIEYANEKYGGNIPTNILILQATVYL